MTTIESENAIREPESGAAKTAKTVMIVLAIVLALVLAVFVYVWIDRAKMISELTADKITLELNLEQLRNDYDQLETSNEALNTHLEEEREKVNVLIERLKRTEASNRSQIRKYEQELGLLRDIMRGYVLQIDSLNQLNQRLRAETVMAKTEARESTKKYETLVKHTDDLTAQVEKGSVVKVRDIVATAITKKGKETARSRNTTQLRVCFSFLENSIATRGLRNVYIRVKGPDKILLAQADNNYFTVNGEQLIYSAMREVDYQGEDLDVCIYYGNAGEQFSKGVYAIDIYSGGAPIGAGQLLLK
jgi:type II secretory pathway pseudopilin PulG